MIIFLVEELKLELREVLYDIFRGAIDILDESDMEKFADKFFSILRKIDDQEVALEVCFMIENDILDFLDKATRQTLSISFSKIIGFKNALCFVREKALQSTKPAEKPEEPEISEIGHGDEGCT